MFNERAFERTCLPGSRDSFHDVAKIAAGFPTAAAERQKLRKSCRAARKKPIPPPPTPPPPPPLPVCFPDFSDAI